MEDRKKFTYRPDSDSDELLEQGLKKYNITSLNKLINLLVSKAMVEQPKEIQSLRKEITGLQKQLKEAEEDKNEIETEYNQIKALLLNIEKSADSIKSLLS